LKSYNILGHAFLQELNLSQRNTAAYDALQFRLGPPPQRAITSSPKKVKASLRRPIFRLQPINGQTVIVIWSCLWRSQGASTPQPPPDFSICSRIFPTSPMLWVC